MTGTDAVNVEPARPADVRAIAHLHAASISEGFLSSLGPRFLTVVYRAMVHAPDVSLLVVRRDETPVGFVAGSAKPAAFYRRFLRRGFFRAAASLAPRAIRPRVARRLIQTLLHLRRARGRSSAELLAIAVAPGSRRHGLGSTLVHSLEDELLAAGAVDVTVVVAARNGHARAFYEGLGYEDPEPLEVHRGEPSVRYRKTLRQRSTG